VNDLSAETQFFHEISRKVIDFVRSYDGKLSISVSKDVGDYATEVDLAVEEMIVAEINARFPGDQILAEEGHSDTPIPDTRIWIIDPICGTTNLRRGLSNFCTNVALADKGELIASCVVDHSHGDYFWSVGGKQVFINDVPFVPSEPEARLGKAVDVNLGALGNLPADQRKRHAAFVEKLLADTDYYQLSMGSSLAFAYTAIGKLDGFISPYDKTWDISAASFLIQQAGGTITQANGEPWQLQPTTSSIGSLYPDIHAKMVEISLAVEQ
jgi:myo-inositol-1(or 4)-monophosphatase